MKKIILGLLTVLLIVGCLNTRRRRVDQRISLQKFATDISRERPEIDEDKLKDFFFDLKWDSFLRDEIITCVTMQGRHLYAYTVSNRLYQISMRDGVVRWVFDVGMPLDFQKTENPVCVFVYPAKLKKDLGRYDEVYIVAQDVLIAIDLESGSELWRYHLPFSASAPPAASPSHVYIGSWDDRTYAISKETNVIDWFYRTNEDVTARPVAESPLVYIPSSDGGLYSLDAVKGTSLGKPFRTGRPITADPLIHKSLLYVGSNDYSLYVLNKDDGRMEWKHETGGIIEQQPRGVGKYIFAISKVQAYKENSVKYTPTMFGYERKGRDFATKKTTFDVLWSRQGARKFLAAGADDVYVLERGEGNQDQIVKLDKAKGFYRDAFPLSNVDFWVSNAFNVQDRRERAEGGIIIAGFRNGWIFAMKEQATRR